MTRMEDWNSFFARLMGSNYPPSCHKRDRCCADFLIWGRVSFFLRGEFYRIIAKRERIVSQLVTAMSKKLSDYSRHDSQFGQANRHLARRLAAYLPVTVTRQILRESLPQPGVMQWINAATLFADISGFTAMSEALATDGPRGAETLNRRLLMTFTALISAIHDAGGAVSHFHGDAMMVYFPDGDGQAAARALGCARFMQSLMLTSYSEFLESPSGRIQQTFSLTMRIGLGYGRCFETVVGELDGAMEFVLAGTAVDEAVAAEGQATAGEVVASQNILKMARMPHSEQFRVVKEVPPVPRADSPLYWDSFSSESLNNLLHFAPAFIPPALVERLKNPNTQFVAEHRPATSMFVRFEGIDFTDDRAGEQLQAYYQHVWKIVQQYGGDNSRVNRILTGDKGSHLHIIFGAPIAPDAPDQATRCALILQRSRLPFITKQQIGLCAGRVFACAVGSQNRREYTVVGRIVNLSSRLTGLCQDGMVLLDAATADRVVDAFVFDTIDNVVVKGMQRPMKLYVPLEEKAVTAQARSRTSQSKNVPFGRTQEQIVLESYLDDGLNGRGEVIAMFGPHGSGQVGMLSAAIHYWQLNRGRVFSALSQRHLVDQPLAPWVEIWRSLFELTPDMDPVDEEAAVRDYFEYYWPDFCGDPSVLKEMIGAQKVASVHEDPLPLAERQAELFKTAFGLLARISKQRPILLIIEAVNWIDPASLHFLDYLAERAGQFGLTIIVTYRESVQFNFFNSFRNQHYKKLHLADLSPERALQLVRERLNVKSLPRLFEQRLGIRDRDGRLSPVNPLFLEESLNFMLAEGAVVNRSRPGASRVRLQETAMLNLQVPDRVYAILLSRLDRLSPDLRSLLQTAAVIGRSFDLATLERLSSGVDDSEAALEQLVEREIIVRDEAGDTQSYMFSHALAHDVVYQSIPYARRQKLHASIGDLIVTMHGEKLEPFYALLAYHYGQTDRHETGLMYALAAADQAASRHENEEASNFYRRAVHHLSQLNERSHWQTAVHVFASHATIYRIRGELSRAAEAVNEALKLCLLYSVVEDAVSLYNLMAEIRFYQGRYSDALRMTQKVFNSHTQNAPSTELSQANLIAGMALSATNRQKEALHFLIRAEANCAGQDNKSQQIKVWQAMAMVYRDLRYDQIAIETAQKAVAAARDAGSPSQIGISLFNLARVHMRVGEPQLALVSSNEAIDLIRPISLNWYAHILSNRADIHVYLGNLPQALHDLKTSVELFESMDDPLGLLRARLVWGISYCRAQNDWYAAQQQLVEVGELVAGQMSESEMYKPEAARLWLGLGQTALHQGHFEQAHQLLSKAKRVIEKDGLTWWTPAVMYLLGLLLCQSSNDRLRAQRCFSLGITAVEQGGNPDELILLYWQLAELADDATEKQRFLAACAEAGERRARFFDKIACYRVILPQLIDQNDSYLRALGQKCRAFIENV